ncbi:MAG: hypothetical protein KKD33_10245 [Verrucomicrobia bacterium]|nr:hypothetical protein [Verrucomicrobiota bacterium]
MTILNTLYLTNSVLTNALLTCGGNLTVTNSGTNSGAFYVYSGMTNSTWPNYGGLVRVTGDVFVASNSYIYPYSHPTNGGSVFFSVRNLTLASNGAINATGLGYAGVVGTNGLGPGRGYMKDDWVGSGAGYGGAGGAGGGTGPAGGTTYGSSNAPVDPGSSGGGSKPGGVYKQGGNGGGSVRIQASQRVTVNGAISAAGNAAGGSYGGGGSGGGIYVHCREFCGSGTITAIGGNGGHPTAGGGGGGGGRIAVWREYDHSSGLTNYVTGGTGTVSGGLGTVVFVLIPHKGTIISVR